MKLQEPRNATFECLNSTNQGPKVAKTVKWRLLHQGLHLAITEKQQNCTHNSRRTT